MNDGASTRRDRAVNCAAFPLSLILGALIYSGSLDGAAHYVPYWQKPLDISLGLLACLLVWKRRHTTTALVIMPLVALSALAQGGALAVLFTAAAHRRTTEALTLAVGYLAAAGVFAVWRPQRDTMLSQIVEAAACLAIAIAWGMFVRARRDLVRGLHAQVAQAEGGQALVADRARLEERTRIARDMHDVLAHRISLVALQAGALTMRPDAPAARVRETAELLRSTARQALEELRGVIGVLRGTETGIDPPLAPQPALCDIARLVEENRLAGRAIDLTMEIPDTAAVPADLARDAYRIVQESLTNITKHAPGSSAHVRIADCAHEALLVSVRNHTTSSPPTSSLPGAGAGLIGLRERVALAGGTISFGIDDQGEFVVEASLPWR